MKSTQLIPLLFLLPATAGALGLAADPSSPLETAQKAYLERDYATMSTAMRKALESPRTGPVERENLFGLLAATYQARGYEGIPADWKLPPEITKMKIVVNRILRDLPRYSFRVQGETAAIGTIRQLRVTRYPDQVVLDRKAGLGEWEERLNEDGDAEYELCGARTQAPVAAGLYLLRIELASGSAVDGWFILDPEVNSTESPALSSPSYGQQFTTTRPMFSWADFRSPQYKPFERRTVWMAVTRADPPAYDWDVHWSFYADAPTLTDITVGAAPGEHLAKPLTTGNYAFYLNYQERRRFGDLILVRASAALHPFSIR